ncbi:DUF4340 domain-containing protein [Opitutales bacterium]|nr:DUF4340 domain-containing protein [Opitutales bacterium]
MKKTKTFLILANIVVALGIYLSWESNNETSYSLSDSLLSVLSNMDEIEWIGSESNNSIKIRKDADAWKLIRPYVWSANTLAISNFQTKLAHFYYDPLYELDVLKKRGEILEDYGISQKSKSIKISGNNQTIKFWIGSVSRDEESVFALVHDTKVNKKTLIKINNEIIKFIDIKILDWTDRNFVKTPLYAIEKISVKFQGENNQTNETSLVKENQNWNFITPFIGKADAEKVMLYLNSLLSANISSFHMSDEDHNKSTVPKWTTKLELHAFNKTESFLFGINKMSDQSEIIGKSISNQTTFILDLDFMKNLNDWTTKLRSRAIFNFSSDKIESFEVLSEVKKIRLSNSPITQWNITESNQTNSYSMNADPDSVFNFLRTLNTASIEQFLTYDIQENDIQKFKMNDPIFKLITKNINSLENEYFFNRTADEESMWTIWDKNQSIICLVKEDFGKLLTIDPLEFKSKLLMPTDFATDEIILGNNDTNETILLNSEKNQNSFSIITKFEANEFVNDMYLEDGSWIAGDWVPWKYQLMFRSKKNEAVYNYRLSQRKGATTWYAGDPKTGLIFNLPITIIEEIANLLMLDKRTQN